MIIKIKNLRLKTIVGVYEWEQNYLRDIIINLRIETDNNASMQSDQLSDTIDYDVIIAKIKNFAENNRCQLIEKMVGSILDEIMQDSRIKKCRLEIDKVGVYEELDSLSVTQIRKRK